MRKIILVCSVLALMLSISPVFATTTVSSPNTPPRLEKEAAARIKACTDAKNKVNTDFDAKEQEARDVRDQKNRTAEQEYNDAMDTDTGTIDTELNLALIENLENPVASQKAEATAEKKRNAAIEKRRVAFKKNEAELTAKLKTLSTARTNALGIVISKHPCTTKPIALQTTINTATKNFNSTKNAVEKTLLKELALANKLPIAKQPQAIEKTVGKFSTAVNAFINKFLTELRTIQGLDNKTTKTANGKNSIFTSQNKTTEKCPTQPEESPKQSTACPETTSAPCQSTQKTEQTINVYRNLLGADLQKNEDAYDLADAAQKTALDNATTILKAELAAAENPEFTTAMKEAAKAAAHAKFDAALEAAFKKLKGDRAAAKDALITAESKDSADAIKQATDTTAQSNSGSPTDDSQ